MLAIPHAAAASLDDLLNNLSFGTPEQSGFARQTARPIARALAASVAKSLPVVSASPGFVWEAGPSGTLERSTDVLGQLFLERPETLGPGRMNVGFSYQHVDIDSLNGHDLNTLHDLRLIDGAFRVPRLRIALETEEMVTNITYGVARDLDLNLVAPVLYSRLRVGEQLTFVSLGLGTTEPLRSSGATGTAVGIGDLLLRAKYRLPNLAMFDTALGFLLRLPSGSQGDFQGIGRTEISPLLYLSYPKIPIAKEASLKFYLNVGVDVAPEDVGASEARWGAGGDCRVGSRVVLAAGMLGRHDFRSLAPSGTFTREALEPRSGRITQGPLFGIDLGRPDYVDLSVGGRVDVWRERVIAFANVVVPVTRDGFRAEVIPTVGIEFPFFAGPK